ncbi:GDSL esterase/lipase 6 [Gossypium australe]|uniref:GDSL esterase/lipase 6 n=1 Tax=Gossypium australe TaxID=47621 RepID=A0A5B6V0M1_9ROSI|nr:GDSL esterase/lipase 6 [Gossypium australe]
MEKKNLYTHLLILLVLINLSSSLNVPAIFIFGDSVFDAGNNHFIKNCSVQADFPPYGSTFFHHPTGRFTDGRTVADFISQFIGIGLQQPYLEAQIAVMNGSRKEYPSNGLNFASAGSGVLQGTNKDWTTLQLVPKATQDLLMRARKSILVQNKSQRGWGISAQPFGIILFL